MKWDKIAGVRRELKKMAREAMGREYIFSVTFACMMNLIPWMVHKFLGSHWAVGIISSTIRRCGFAGLSIPLLCFSLRIILRNMLIVLPISIFVIKNGYSTPYVLEESYRGVNANNIYTRVMDSNTPKNKTAEISQIEYLWKKRFRLLMAPLEQVFYFLLKREEWEDVPDDSSVTRMYYKYSPEYVIEYAGCDDRDGYVYYLFSQIDSRPHWYNIYVKYHQTILFSTIGVGLDGGRYFTNVPCTDFLFDDWHHEGNISFKYYVKGTKEMILHDFFCDYDSHDAMYARDRFEECILIFVSDTEKENFKDYAASKWSKRQDYLEDVRLPRMELPGVYREDAFKEEYENALVLKKMLDEYRTY